MAPGPPRCPRHQFAHLTQQLDLTLIESHHWVDFVEWAQVGFNHILHAGNEHGWMNRFRRILVRWEKLPQTFIDKLHLTCGTITWRATGLLALKLGNRRTYQRISTQEKTLCSIRHRRALLLVWTSSDFRGKPHRPLHLTNYQN